MTDREIREELRIFAKKIFHLKYIREAKDIEKDLNKFCKDNNVSAKQMQEFAESGAGEMLYALTHYA